MGRGGSAAAAGGRRANGTPLSFSANGGK